MTWHRRLGEQGSITTLTGRYTKGVSCSGHGVCLSDQGACVCFQGYGGAVCEGQVSSFDYSAKLSSVRFATSVITTFENQVLNVGMVRSLGTQYAVKVVFTISDITTTEGKNYVVAQDRTVVKAAACSGTPHSGAPVDPVGFCRKATGIRQSAKGFQSRK